MRRLPQFFINLFYCIQIFTHKKKQISSIISTFICPCQSLYKYIYTHKHTCIYIKKNYPSCVSEYTMLSEWVLRQTNLGTTVLSGTGQRSFNSKCCNHFCQNRIILLPHCGWFVWVERGIMITVMVTPLKQGTQSKKEGFGVKICIAYTFLLRKKFK